ncbi:MAG: peptide chain release factor 1 [Malacoplasma sp.]|nr:peptide chain release factor 1 [Malacoplasma sp.]MDE6429327.1 peptide chain release factor 1 [Malacoplasma sp.]
MIYNEKLYNSLNLIEEKFNDLNKELETVGNNIKRMSEINKLLKDTTPIVEKFREYKKILDDISSAEKIIKNEKDNELIELAQIELTDKKPLIDKYEYELKILLLPKDPNDDKNVIVEMRPAAGGDESSIFVGDLFSAYKRYADSSGWKVKMLEIQESSHGYGFISFMISGENVYSKMKFESGVHRVQRVPATESKGRVHTSTITVAVLPEIEDVELVINNSDLKIDTYRASGAGGQHINKTESAVRITHIPTGIFVACQEGKSQIENRETAMKMLRAKLWEIQEEEKRKNISDLRKGQVGTGERAEKIRTYNYPQNRVTDHRINLTLNKLDSVMMGNLEEIIDSLISYDESIKMQEAKI